MDLKAYPYEAPVEPERWIEPDFHTDHAFSDAFAHTAVPP